MKRGLAKPIVGLSLLLGASAAQGQELNYGDYERLFGEPVTVSATGKPERVSNTPVLMDVISAEDIKRSGARDIPTLLRRLAGVDVVSSAPDTEDLGIGGYIQPFVSRVMVLINGRQVYFDAFGNVFWSTLPVELDEIRQIEVIKGPQSALYGFNAVDGVINIVTFDPVEDKINSVRTRLGNHARRDFSAITTQSLAEGTGVRLTVADDHADDYGLTVKTPANLAFLKDPNRRSASFDAGITLPDDSRLNLEGSHTDVSERLANSNLLFAGHIKTNSIKGGYVTETAIGRVSASADYNDIDMPWAIGQPIGPFSLDDRTAAANLADLFKLGPSDSFRLGLEGRHDRMLAPSISGGTLTGDLGAGSAMWEHEFTPRLSVVNAVRYDYFKLGRSGQHLSYDIFTNADFDRSDQGTSVNSAVVAKMTEDDTLRLSFARGLKLPSLANFGLVEHFLPQYTPVPFAPKGLYYYGNPDLRASAVYDYQAGWDHWFRGLDAKGRINIYHDMTMSHIGSPYSLINGSLAQVVVPSTGSVTNGLQLELEHKANTGWNWGGNYTYQRLHEHHDWGLRNASPDHKANLNVGYGWGEWEADLYLNYISATKGLLVQPGPPTSSSFVRVGGHASLSPRIGWHPTDNVTVELVGQNLWPYRDIVLQEMEPSFFLSVKISY